MFIHVHPNLSVGPDDWCNWCQRTFFRTVSLRPWAALPWWSPMRFRFGPVQLKVLGSTLMLGNTPRHSTFRCSVCRRSPLSEAVELKNLTRRIGSQKMQLGGSGTKQTLMKLFEVVWKQNEESCLHCRETIYGSVWCTVWPTAFHSYGLIDEQQYSSVSAAIAVHNFIAYSESCRPMFAHQKTSDDILEMDMIRKLSHTFKLCVYCFFQDANMFQATSSTDLCWLCLKMPAKVWSPELSRCLALAGAEASSMSLGWVTLKVGSGTKPTRSNQILRPKVTQWKRVIQDVAIYRYQCSKNVLKNIQVYQS